jgi:hypothetical protein
MPLGTNAANHAAGAANPAPDAPPSAPDHGVLEAVFFVASTTLYYAGLKPFGSLLAR